MFARLRRFVAAVAENRTLRVMDQIHREEVERRNQIIARLKVDLAIVIRDRDQLLAEKYKAIQVGRFLSGTRDGQMRVH